MAMSFGNRNSRNNDRRDSGDDWKADAFLNFYLPFEKSDGSEGKLKLAFAPLKEDDVNQSELIKMLRADPEKGVKALLAALVIDFREAKAAAPVKFKFGT